MSDRLAVFNHGKVEQVGTPSDVYENPRNAFVAGFVGTSNVITGQLAERIMGSSQPFTVRPEKLVIGEPATVVPSDSCGVEGVVTEAIYLGMYTKFRVEVDGVTLEAASQNAAENHFEAAQQVGRRVGLTWKKSSCRPLEDQPRDVDAGMAPALAGAGNDNHEEEPIE
jgi:putative spermidine/putrescine transport system ATP-binding protein